MTGFSLQTLGFPEIHGDNGPIKLNLRKGLALLIYLAEAQGAVAREVIATLLWPESPGETSRARLRRMLHRIELTGVQLLVCNRSGGTRIPRGNISPRQLTPDALSSAIR